MHNHLASNNQVTNKYKNSITEENKYGIAFLSNKSLVAQKSLKLIWV